MEQLLLLLTITATPSGKIPSPWTCSSPSPSFRRHCCLNCWLATSCPAKLSILSSFETFWFDTFFSSSLLLSSPAAPGAMLCKNRSKLWIYSWKRKRVKMQGSRKWHIIIKQVRFFPLIYPIENIQIWLFLKYQISRPNQGLKPLKYLRLGDSSD